MITKFDTTNSPAPGSKSSGGGNKLMLILGLAVGGFLLYKFVIKPRMEQKDEEHNG